MAERISREELRHLIREALKEALAGGAAEPAPPRPDKPAAPQDRAARQGSFSVTSGLLTEALVSKVAAGHDKIVIAGDVVVTPLARDRARILKVEIVRQKP